MSTPLPRQLWSLVKPRIVALLCLTGVGGVLAAGGLGPVPLVAFLLAGALVAGGAAALNCWYDRELDRRMARTADRPLPSGDLSARAALAFALALLAVGTATGLAALPTVAVGYMWLGVAAYVGLYTVALKRRHWLGVVLGGSAGSFPVLAGWTAVRPLAGPAVVLAAVVFVWTPAHAWALAFVYRDDFAAAAVPTLPVVADARTVGRAVWWAALATAAVAALAVPLSGALYAAVLALATPPFLAAFRRFRRELSAPTAVRAFFASNCFLGVLALGWAVDGLLGRPASPLAALPALLVPPLFAGLFRARPALRSVEAAPGAGPLVALTRDAATHAGAAIGRLREWQAAIRTSSGGPGG